MQLKKNIYLILILIGFISTILAFVNYDNKKENLQENSVSTFIREDVKTFLNDVISKKKYPIEKIEQELVNESYFHSVLINNAVRFKAFFDSQDYSVELYSKNCKSLSSQLNIENFGIKNRYAKGIENVKYLFDITSKKEPNFSNQYQDLLKTNMTNLNNFLEFSDTNCNQMLSQLKMRNLGLLNDDKIGKNILFFNYITNPIDELLNNNFQEFSSFKNAPNEDFYLTIQLPKSWNIKEKKDYTYASTICVAEPYEKFLNGIFTISFQTKINSEMLNKENFSDNNITETLYGNDELLKPIIYSLNKELKITDKIKTTLYQAGEKKQILYIYETEIPNNLVNSQKARIINSIFFHNGKLIHICFTGTISNNKFSSFPYYSKIFLKVLNSIKFRELNKNTISE